MPKYVPSDEEMDSSYGGEAAAVTPPDKAPAETESVDEENAGAAEILVEKSKLPAGTKEGDTCTFRVVKDFGNEVSLEYVEEGGEEEAEAPETTTGNEAAELTALSEEGM